MNRLDNTKNKTNQRNSKNIYISMVLTLLIGSIFIISINFAMGGVGNPVPDPVTNLTNNSYEYNYINWTWSDPTNIDPNLLILAIYIDGHYIDVIPGGVQFYNATNFEPGTQHTIGIQTIDIRGYKTNLMTYLTSYTKPLESIPTPTYTPTPVPTPTPTPTDTPTPVPTATPTPTDTPTPVPTATPTPNNTYYVSPSGDDNNPGTQSQPFQTIYRGIFVASNGDTVQVLPGTYYPTYSTRPIINKSIRVNGSGRDSIIDGSNITQYTDGWYEGLVEIKADNVYFGGFTIQNSISPDASTGSAGIVIISNNNIVERNLVKNTYDSGIKLLGGYHGTNLAYNNIIRYNELYQVVWGGNSSTKRNEAISIVEADTIYAYYNYIHETGMTPTGQNKFGGEGIDVYDNSKNAVVHHNYVYDGVSVGLYLGGDNITAYDNIAERITEFGNAGDGLDINAEQNGTVNGVNSYNNIVYNTGNGYAICNYHDPVSAPGTITNVTLDSNIAYVSNVTDYGDLIVENCGNNLSNISLTNNYANKIIIDSAVSGAVTLSGNDQNLTDIANRFNGTYYKLKDDILGHVNYTNSTLANSFSFIAFADTKSGPQITAAESRSIVNDGLNPNFIIFPGDLCPDTNCFATDWKYAINGDITGLTSDGLFNKTFATRGNHDTLNISNWQLSFDFAGVASRIGATNYAEQTKDMTYSFDYGNSHFVGLDVPGDISVISPSQIIWLDNDLTAAENRGLIHAFLFWHGPIYYVDGHPSDPPSDLINVLNKHFIVSAAFFGHEHVITYTHINDSRISGITHSFEEFVVAGAGADLYDTNVSRVDYCIGKSGPICPNLYGYMSVDVSNNDFNVSIYNMNGTLDKVITFNK